MQRQRLRPHLPFRAVNRCGYPGYDPELQRHHLLPRQLLTEPCFGSLFEAVRPRQLGFNDFRRNGLLLPASDEATIATGLPLHRGPHRHYNRMVIERFGLIENDWSRQRLRRPNRAREQALFRIGLLQRALRRRLLDPIGRRVSLNSRDPLGHAIDFSELDAMAELLWNAAVEAENAELR